MVISATTFTSQNTNNNLRDASFSSYLTNKEPFHLTRKEPFHLGVKKEEDGEIGVFDAEKYFNGVEIDTPIPRVSTIDANKIKYLKDQQQNRNYKVQYGTSSVGSESSVNSQSAFLQSALKTSSSSNSRKNHVHRKSLLASLGCNCSCYDKNSVDVNDHAGEISFNKSVVHGKSTSEKIIKHDQDSSNHSVKNKKTENPLAATELMMNKDFPTYKVQLQQVEKPRKKLEVFGSPILDERCNKSLSFDMRLKKPSWEASTKLVEQETEFSTNCDESNYDDDAGSDASSDLFEIESLTGNKTNSFFTRTSTTSHVASGCNSPTCYAPSEASIEWSVITASAVEYSAISDHEDQGSVITIRSPIRTSINSSSNGKHKVNKEISMPKRRPSKFLGCNSQKSVGVAVDAFTTTYEKQSSNQKIVGKSEMLPQMTKFKVESFGARNEQHGYGKPPLRRSHEPHGAQLLYI
ncbi:unnamed protein product [Trifolium pratense]|uniref:Uncharacterized protein n=1 Tax=Trifolium pratense TaxID=57577 RepID=A0ACB0JWE0_TRIPR|nr:unnamed protein product [Trifolium pratense]